MRTGETTRLQVLALLLAMSFSSGCGSGSGSDGSNSGTHGNSGSENPPNSAPTISGSPGTTILIDNEYAFTPSASDPDGDTLTYSILSKPGWATFNTVTGRLSGQALPGDEGLYDAVQITVTDGNAGTSLPIFSITVYQGANGSMTLSWTPPTENTDGTALTDLAGYNIYFGLSEGTYPNRIYIDNPSISTYVIENLLPNTYYIVATSFNSLGIDSAFSNVAVKTVTPN